MFLFSDDIEYPKNPDFPSIYYAKIFYRTYRDERYKSIFNVDHGLYSRTENVPLVDPIIVCDNFDIPYKFPNKHKLHFFSGRIVYWDQLKPISKKQIIKKIDNELFRIRGIINIILKNYKVY